MSLKIAVLSDLHLHRRVDPASWELARRAFTLAASADHVIVAGDLFDSAEAMRQERGLVELQLRKAGLWSGDRLTLVVGNHDFFELGHRSGRMERVREAARVARVSAQASFETFCGWAGELVSARERFGSSDLFPYRRRLGEATVVAADSTARVTALASQGYWRTFDDEGTRGLFSGTRGVRLLALHNPPFAESGELSWVDRLSGYVDGFPKGDFERFEQMAGDVGLDLVVAGHVHAGLERWSWKMSTATQVQVIGRTGGLGGQRPCYRQATVAAGGAVTWRTVVL